MATFILESEIGEGFGGVLVNLGGGFDAAKVGARVTIVSTEPGGSAISGTGQGHLVTVAGSVSAPEGNGILLGDDLAAAGNRLVITKTGVVGGGFNGYVFGARVYGSGTVLENAGKLSGFIGFGFGVQAGGATRIENDGMIFGEGAVIRMEGTGVSRLINSGFIEGLTASYFGSFLGETVVARDIIINSGIMRGMIDMGAGNDLYDGSKGGRVIGNIVGGVGDDRYLMGARAEVLLGGTGADMADYSKAKAGVKLALDGAFANTGWAAGDTYDSIEQVRGSKFNDTIRGSAGPETLMGGAGNDRIIAGSGFNHLYGGAGQDKMTGGSDIDIYYYNNVAELGDEITNFDAAEDSILFNINFSGKGFGGASAAQFRTRADNVAQDANDYFIFRTTDKSLWFDADGAGGKGPVLIADLQQNATLTHNDIVYLLF
jgi:Ca2+-binding RTX toxin-like protein